MSELIAPHQFTIALVQIDPLWQRILAVVFLIGIELVFAYLGGLVAKNRDTIQPWDGP